MKNNEDFFNSFFPLDQTKSLTFHICGTSGPLEKNYTICFVAFSICMIFALIIATQFQFSYDTNQQVPLSVMNKNLNQVAYPIRKLNTNEHDIQNIVNNEHQLHINLKQREQYQISNTMKFMQLIRIFMVLKNGTFLFISWWETE